MLTVKGTYKNGKVYMDEEIRIDKPVNVIITFLQDVKAPARKKLDMNKFSFKRAKEMSANYKGLLSDAVVEERRSAV